MNIELLKDVIKYFKEEPRRLAMQDWCRSVDPNKNQNPPCGTTACVAGATCIVSGFVLHYSNEFYPINTWDEDAKRILKLNTRQAARLFHTTLTTSAKNKSRWPEKYDKAYRVAKTPVARLKVLISRINHFIKTKGAE